MDSLKLIDTTLNVIEETVTSTKVIQYRDIDLYNQIAEYQKKIDELKSKLRSLNLPEERPVINPLAISDNS